MRNEPQQQYGDDDIIIKGQLMNFRTTQTFNFIVVCKDNWAITTADNLKFLKKMVKAENRRGNKFIKFLPKKNWVVEYYKDKTKKEIAKKIVKNLKSAGANITKK